MEVKRLEDMQCEECGGYADVVQIERVKGIKYYRFLCDECLKKEEKEGE